MIDVVLTVYNNLELTQKCVASVVRCAEEGQRLLIVDNGSDEETSLYLRDLAQQPTSLPIQVIRIEENQGFVVAANTGLKASTAESACLISNDTIVTSGWLSRMHRLLFAKSEHGIVGPHSNNYGLYPPKGIVLDDFARNLAHTRHGDYSETAACVGFCMLIKRAVMQKIGYLDEVFSPGYFEDTDYCRRAVDSGFVCLIARDAYVWHREHSTFSSKEREQQFLKNRDVCESRWGRPERLVCVISKKSHATAVVSFALAQARKGHWVRVYVSFENVESIEVLKRHSQIAISRAPKSVLGIMALLYVLKKRKKKISAVYYGSNVAWAFFKNLFPCRVEEVVYGD